MSPTVLFYTGLNFGRSRKCENVFNMFSQEAYIEIHLMSNGGSETLVTENINVQKPI